MDDSPDDERESEHERPPGIERRSITPDSESAEYDLLEIVAETENCEINDLPSLYNEVEHVVETMYRTPPSSAAQMVVSFSYAGYRITLHRDGAVELVPVKASLSESE